MLDRAKLALWQRRVAFRRNRYQAAVSRHDHPGADSWRGLLDHAKTEVVKLQARLNPPSATAVSPAGIKFIQGFEGWYSKPYDDGVGVKTIGWGFIASDFPNGKVPASMTRAQGDAMLTRIINEKYAPPVLKALAPLKPTQGMVDAGISFAYNLGVGAFQGALGFETLTRALAYRDRQKVADAFLLYSNPGDPNVHAGLLRRRNAERTMFLS